MNKTEIETLIDEIDDLVSKAQVTPDHDERVSLLKEALGKACKYLRRLNRQIAEVVHAVLLEGRFDPAAQALPLRDIAKDDPELEVFREKKYLVAFLHASRDLLQEQMNCPPAKIEKLIDQVERTYDQFMGEKIAIKPLVQQFEKLQRFFCRPPWGGPGGSLVGPEPTDDGPSGVTKSRSEKICLWLTTATTVGTFLMPIIEKIVHFMSAAAETPSEADKDVYRLRVLALVLASSLAAELESRQEFRQPVKVRELELA